MSLHAARRLQALLLRRTFQLLTPSSSCSALLCPLPTCSRTFHSSPPSRLGLGDGDIPGSPKPSKEEKDRSVLEGIVIPRKIKPSAAATAAGVNEWSQDLDKDSIKMILEEFVRRPMVRQMASEAGIGEKLFFKSYQHFQDYCIHNLNSIDPALLVAFRDILKNGHDVESLYDYFIEHAKKIFPHIEAMPDLRLISDMQLPHTWYPEARRDKRKIIFHAGPTNSGKTHNALQKFREAKTGVYCGPLKLLAAEVFTRTNELGVPCDMVTGEERRFAVDNYHPAGHLSSTVEMLSTSMRFDVAVIDEIQMLRDAQRGWAWTRALLGVIADEVHLCGEPAAINIVKKILEPIGEEVEVFEYERKSKLTISEEGICSFDKIEDGDCIVCFSKKQIYYVTKRLDEYGIKPAVIYGDLPPATKVAQATKFNDPNDACNVLVATDAVGMGLNLNIRRIIFNSLTRQNELIPNYQALQIAGRAGRYGTAYEEGIVTTMRKVDIGTLKDLLSETVPPIEQAGLAPTFDQIESFSYHLPNTSFVRLLHIFVALHSISDHFFICTVLEMLNLAEIIDEVPNLSLKVRYTFCVSPLNIDHKLCATTFVKMARRFASGSPLTYDWLESVVQWKEEPPRTYEELADLERIYEILEEYLWLSLRFPDMLPDEELVRDKAKHIDALIAEGINNLLQLLTGPLQGKMGSIVAKARARRQTAKEKAEWEEMQKAESKPAGLNNISSKRKGLRTNSRSTATAETGRETPKDLDGNNR